MCALFNYYLWATERQVFAFCRPSYTASPDNMLLRIPSGLRLSAVHGDWEALHLESLFL